MLCPRPARFRRTWWVKCFFSSLVAQELTVAAYLAVHTEVPLRRFPTAEVFIGAIISGGIALFVQAICAFVFIQCGRYTDILGAREVEKMYVKDVLLPPAVEWAPSDRSDSPFGSRRISRRAATPARRTRPPSSTQENPYLGYRSNYGYGAAYDARQACGIALPAGLSTAARGAIPSPPPSPSAPRAGEERRLLQPTLEEYEHEEESDDEEPGSPTAPAGIMALCWAVQLAFALGLLLAACWVAVTRRSWTTHREALMASLFIAFGLRIVFFEPLFMQLIPSCFAGRVFAENTVGTHTWQYRPPLSGTPDTSMRVSQIEPTDDRRLLIVPSDFDSQGQPSPSSSHKSLGPSISQRPSRTSEEANPVVSL